VSDRNTGHTEHQPQGKANGERPCRYSQNNEVLLRHLIPSKATQPLTARRRDDGNSLPRQTHQGFEWSVSYKGANALRDCPFRFLGTPVRPTHIQARDRRAASYEFAGARVDTYEELVRTVADRINAGSRLLPLPFALWRILASRAEFVPGSPLTRNQVALMQRDRALLAVVPAYRGWTRTNRNREAGIFSHGPELRDAALGRSPLSGVRHSASAVAAASTSPSMR
jgi:hypothetical protein